MNEERKTSLEAQLDLLRQVTAADSARRVRQGLELQVQSRKRLVQLALAATVVSALATGVFVMQGDPFGYFALSFTTVILAVTAVRYAREARQMAETGSGRQLLTRWRSELKQQLRHTLLAQLVAAMFSLLAGWVIWRHGPMDVRSGIFVVVALAIWAFAIYQLLVVRPALERELELIADGQ